MQVLAPLKATPGVQAAVLARVILAAGLAVLVVLGFGPVALLIACVVALVAPSWHAAPRESVALGSREFIAQARALAPEDHVVRGVVVRADCDLRSMVRGLPARGELLIEAQSFKAVQRLAPEWLTGDTAVRVLDRHEIRFGNHDHLVWRGAKRAIDVVLAAFALLALVPVLALCALAIKLDSPGPVIFRQDRLGQAGRRFRCYKLRTMTVGEDNPDRLAYVAAMIQCQAIPLGGLFKPPENPRITRVGRVLRRFSIDELPQLWNVLRGDMSLVGPRPPVLEEAKYYDERSWRRLEGKPGLTGLAQISGRSGLRFDEIVNLDLAYLEAGSILLELKILVLTPVLVLTARGAA